MILFFQFLGYFSFEEKLPQVGGRAAEDDRGVGAVLPDLGVPLGPHVVQRVGVGDAEADQEHVGVRVGERPHRVVGDGT